MSSTEWCGPLGLASDRLQLVIHESRGRDSKAIKTSENSIQQVLEQYQVLGMRLVQSAESLCQTNQEIQSEVEGALVQLQFQDRISQMLCHVRDSVNRVAKRMSEEPEALDITAALSDLEASYAMAEERELHGYRPRRKSPEVAGITFF